VRRKEHIVNFAQQETSSQWSAYSVWDEETCQRVHEATLKVLAETGVQVQHDGALGLLSARGARVDGQRVRIDTELVEEALATVPRSFSVKPRGDGAPLVLQPDNVFFGTGSDCLYYRDLNTGDRRRALNADVEGMAALCDRLPNIDFVMSMGVPQDVPMALDDVVPFLALMAGTRKPLLIATRDGDVLPTMLEMAALCGNAQSFMVYSMPSPPLQHDYVGADKLIACARLGIPVVYGPAPNPGATAPASIAGLTVSSNAEVLSGLVLHQLAQPGAPFIYGATVVSLNMRTSSEIYCAPELYAGQLAQNDLARFYGLPSFGYGGCSDSKCLDEQWSAESALTILLAALSKSTLIHDVGYLESGMQSSLSSIVLGDELIGYVRAVLDEIRVDEETLAVGEIAAVGPGGNHLVRRYTRRHHTGYWRTSILDQSAHDRWVADGGSTLRQRVDQRARALVETRTFELEPTIRERAEGMARGARKH
jgi:trimethylamine--corrinoid protein Co-methyltransferase